jgi:hypothetical protein
MRGTTASTETNMKIILNIETNDPADLSRIAAALNGEAVTVTTTKPATARTTKAAEVPTPTQVAQSADTSVATARVSAPASAAVTAPPSEQPAAVPTEADLIAAGNAAVSKVGNGGPDKVKKYIAEHFQKADGSPGTLKLTAEPQRAKLLADLQAIGRGEIAL